MKKVILSLALVLSLLATTATFAGTATPAPVVANEMFMDVNIYVEPDALKLNVGIIKEAGTRVMVKIIDPNGISILYHQVDVQKVSSHLLFDMSSLENGHYELVITDGDTEEVKEFEIVTSPNNSGVRGILLNQ